MQRRWIMIVGLLGALLATGCASVVEFRLPDEFKGAKQKEDPPGVYLTPHDGIGRC